MIGPRRSEIESLAPSHERLSHPDPSMSDSFDRAPGAGRGRGRGGAALSGADASESGAGACLGGSGSHSSVSAEKQHKTGSPLLQQEPLRPPKTAPLSTGNAGTGRRAVAPSPPFQRPSVPKVSRSGPLKSAVLPFFVHSALLLLRLLLRHPPHPHSRRRPPDSGALRLPTHTSLWPRHGTTYFLPPPRT